MATLQELARNRFTGPPLSAAEERLLQNAPHGTGADCRDLGGGDDPGKADGTPEAHQEKWPDERNVRADLIRWLCVAREAREQIDPRGVAIRGARIMGVVDLSFATISFPLILLSCRVEQPFVLQGAKMTTLSLEGSRTGAIFADGLHVDGTLFLRNGFRADGVVRLPGATIDGNLEATGGTFNNPNGYAIFADHINVRGSVLMKPELGAMGQTQNGFMAAGEVRLVGASIGNSLDAEGGKFKNPKANALTADLAKIDGSIYLTKGFTAEGEVRLVSAAVGGDLNATGGRFENPKEKAVLSADGISVSGNVFLKGAFVAAGHVRLPGAEITGQLVVDSARLDALILESARIKGPFLWRNIYKDSHPDFPNKVWEPSLNLNGATVGSLVDQEASWPKKGQLFLDGFVYDRIGVGLADTRVPMDAAARLRWLRLQPDQYGYLPQPYEQLIAVLRKMGHEHHVAEIAIAKQKSLYEHGDLSLWGKFQSWFLYLAVGYGYSPWLAFIWLLVLVMLGSAVFSHAHSANVLVPSDRDAYTAYEKSKMEQLPPYYPDFHAALYSLDVVLPFDLGQKTHWQLIQRWSGDRAYWRFESYSLIQLFIGWVLLLVAAAVPAGFVKKD